MQSRSTLFALSTAAVLLGGGHALAATDKPRSATPSPSASSQPSTSPAPAKLVDINSASRAELKTLPGIGDAEAERIIAARPYPSKAKLAVDNVLSAQAYAALKGRIVAAQPVASKSKTDTKASTKP